MMLRAAFVPPTEAVERLRALGGRLAQVPGIRPVEPGRVDVPIAGLGNLVEHDANRFAGLLAECLSDLEPIVVRPVAVELHGEDVTVQLDGDLAALSEVARAVGIAAQGVRILVDRRAFRPAVVVATRAVPDAWATRTDVLGELAGTSWLVEDVDLVRTRWFAGEARAETAYRIPFGLDGFGGRDFRTG